ncbi:hypothetical protein BU16DRAFT_532438 [Lophium mytilinum]|uniref:Uncharacterized protein n=1 Tax=Lophium mytilinum TaxID=390894 RepID=A0A6A6RE55_9PEZI|nr:hypothetical protein BU16DRAFT_532438 [Lophium mytilinum]
MTRVDPHSGEQRSSQRAGTRRRRLLRGRVDRTTIDSQIHRYQRRVQRFSKPIKMKDIEKEKPLKLMDLPPEIVTKMVEIALGAGGNIQFYRTGGHHSDGSNEIMIANHSWDGMHISTFSALRLVSKPMKAIADNSFFRHGVVEFEYLEELNMAFDRNIGRNFGDQLRAVSIWKFAYDGDPDGYGRMFENLITLPNLRRLIFYSRWETPSVQGSLPNNFENICITKYTIILDALLTVFMKLRLKYGKRGISIEFDADGNGAFAGHEEVVRRDFIAGRGPTVPLSPDQIKVKTKEINEMFNQALEARERVIHEQSIATIKEQLNGLKREEGKLNFSMETFRSFLDDS